MFTLFSFDKNSSFSDESHFLDSLEDLLEEWEDLAGEKEIDSQEVGFNEQRLVELRQAIKNRRAIKNRHKLMGKLA